MRRLILMVFSHGAVLAIGFALGIYFLPILTAPEAPDAAMLQQKAENAQFTAEFTRELRGSDFLHWGEGTVSITPTQLCAAVQRQIQAGQVALAIQQLEGLMPVSRWQILALDALLSDSGSGATDRDTRAPQAPQLRRLLREDLTGEHR